MTQYIARRLLYAVFVILGVVTAVFILTNLTGDPVQLILGPNATADAIVAMRHRLGLDRPLYIQYLSFLNAAIHGHFQPSLSYAGLPAMDVVLSRYPRTLFLACLALSLELIVSLTLGIISAVKRYSLLDNAVMTLALFGQSIPNFWLGIMLILLFSVNVGWFSSQGFGLSPSYFVLPMITLASPGIARLTRLTRSGMLDILSADYIRTARSKGLRERHVVLRHAFKNAAIPLVTVIGLDFGNLLGGAIITEQIFQWNGVGQLLVDSIGTRDFPVVQAAVFIIAASFVLINLFVDLLYTKLDPRVRLI
ncbi:MAG TPA: ABC transporter permease [Thermomicrobiales bacterium]|nr:ABC transporter permease [Thermomicrobiales bacterium]